MRDYYHRAFNLPEKFAWNALEILKLRDIVLSNSLKKMCINKFSVLLKIFTKKNLMRQKSPRHDSSFIDFSLCKHSPTNLKDHVEWKKEVCKQVINLMRICKCVVDEEPLRWDEHNDRNLLEMPLRNIKPDVNGATIICIDE